MKLLIEQEIDSVETFLTEATTEKSGDIYIQGKFIQTNIVNRNRRFYPKENVHREVERYIKEDIASNRAVGELNHPNHPDINYERACIKIVSLKEDGNDYTGKAKVLQHLPLGGIIAGLIKEGVNVGVSTRGLGSVKANGKGINVVQNDFRLMTAADVVSSPSAPDAVTTAIMENREWVYENGLLIEKETDLKDIINTGIRDKKHLNEIFQDIIKTIGAQ